MYFATPVLSKDNEIIAALIQRVDPTEGFSLVMQFSRIGETGESYAFDRNGGLLSESRFDDHLREIGLIGEHENASLNVEIRNPGGNMVEGYRSSVARSNQPLTKMAQSAVKGDSGPQRRLRLVTTCRNCCGRNVCRIGGLF